MRGPLGVMPARNDANRKGNMARAPPVANSIGRLHEDPSRLGRLESRWKDHRPLVRWNGMHHAHERGECEGFRPGEVFALRWSHVLLNGSGGLSRIAQGKSKAARRILPMTPRVFETLRDRYEAQCQPTDGWLFPSTSRLGHICHNTTKDQHKKAFAALEEARKKNPDLPDIKPFEPYILRHTALTRLAEASADVYALAKIAGYSTILITQRYVHEGEEAVERAFAKREEKRKALPPPDSEAHVGTKRGTPEREPGESAEGDAALIPVECGAEGRNRTGTSREGQGILSPLRLPVPPPPHSETPRLARQDLARPHQL